MSRVGRDYLQTDFYTEVFFRQHGIRFIAIANSVDSALLRRLKEMVAEMIRKIRGSMTNIAENLEAYWMYMVEAQYHLTQIRNEKQEIP